MERTVLSKKAAGCRCGFICGLLFVFVSLLIAASVNAQTVQVLNQDGNCVFLLNFVGDANQGFSPQERKSVVDAAQYWVNMLKAKGTMPIDPVTGNQQPVIITVGKDDDAGVANAYAGSNGFVQTSLTPYGEAVAKPQALIADNYYVAGDVYNPHALIGIGPGLWNTDKSPDVSGIVRDGLYTTIIHEMGHALGVMNDVDRAQDPDTKAYEYVFGDSITRWGSHLRDANGRIAQPGLIIQHPDQYANPNNYFDIGDTRYFDENGNPIYHKPDEIVPQPTFVGKNAMELWYGKSIDALTAEEIKGGGVPITGLIDYGGYWVFNGGGVLSHFDTTNTVMSWQGYRSYGGFIEIEMAALQDIGYSIERRDFFGRSYYQNGNGRFDASTGKWNYGTQIRNESGFSKWDYNAGSYAGTPNMSTYAIGTHLYASNLNVLQLGNILASGAGSAGIRIDGQNNQVTVDKNAVIKLANTNPEPKNNNKSGYYYTDTNGNIHYSSPTYTVDADGIIQFAAPAVDDNGGIYRYYYTDSSGTKNYVIWPWGNSNVSIYINRDGINDTAVSGVGILAAYGSNHNIIHQGYIEASGSGGKGISINFGIPDLGDVRGSYYSDPSLITNDNPNDILPELNGPLVNNLDITGTIIGDKVHSSATYGGADGLGRNWLQNKKFELGAAIYIDQTAHLANLNIMNGAYIDGDIISYWTGPNGYPNTIQEHQWAGPNGYSNVLDKNGNFRNLDAEYRTSDKQTNLTFGLKAAADGSASSQVDPNFHITYSGNINYFRYELFPTIISNLNPVDGTYKPVGIVDPNDNQNITYGNTEQFWRFATWGDGFFFTDSKFFTFEHQHDPTNNDNFPSDSVYAGVATPGIVDLRFAAGTTELVGTHAYVRSATVDAGATLLLTEDKSREYYAINARGNEYDFHSGGPEIHVAASWYDSEYTEGDYSKLAANPAYRDSDTAYNDPLRFMTNNGRVAGNGSFYVGDKTSEFKIAITHLNTPIAIGETYYSGTFVNNGVLSPGANNGKDVGKISIFGDLYLNNTGTYEVTLSSILRTDKDGYATDEDGNHIRSNGDVIDAAGNIVYGEVYNESTHLFQQVRRKRDPALAEGNDKLSVSGETRLGGTLKVDITPGSVFNKAVNNYTIIESGTFTPGTQFSSIITDVAFLSFLPNLTLVQQRGSVLGQLTVLRDMDYFKKVARTHNEKSVAAALDSSLNFGSALGFSLGYKNNSDAALRDIYNQLGASIRANSIMMNLWNPVETVFNHIGYGNVQMETGGRGGINWQRIQERRAKILGQCAVPNRAGSMWGNYFHTAFEAAADGNSAAYNFDRNGFVAGGEMNLTPYSALGFAAAYSNNTLHQGKDKAVSDDYQLGVYLVAAPFDMFELKSYIGLGIQEYDTDRRVRNGNIITSDGFAGIDDRYKSTANGNTFNYSLELARPLALHPAFILRPALGVDVQCIWQSGFGENKDPYLPDSYGSNLYRLNFAKTSFDRTLLRAGFSSETSGCRGGLRTRTFYVSNVGGGLYPVSKASFSAGSDPFVIWGTQLGKNYLNLGISGNLYLDGNKSSSFFFDYDADIYNTQQKIYNHSFNFGFIQNF